MIEFKSLYAILVREKLFSFNSSLQKKKKNYFKVYQSEFAKYKSNRTTGYPMWIYM